MSKRDYPRLTIYEFGEQLLISGDLDPVYIALDKMEWQDEGEAKYPDQLYRWLVAYWCLYHCGAACYLSEMDGDTFWQQLLVAAENRLPAPDGGRWPRGSERRHWRGDAAVRAVEEMRARFSDSGGRPEDVVFYIADHRVLETLPFAEVAARAKTLPLFGPWISFKVADMLDRLGIVSVDFDQASVFMFTDPAKAALMLWRQRMSLPENAIPKSAEMRDQIINEVVRHLADHFRGYSAPPLMDRPVGLQEIETILCKWKSHMNGHYPLFNDIDEIRHGLAGWAPHSETARAMLAAMPRGSEG